MGWFDIFSGGAGNSGGSLMDMAKQGNRQSSILAMLGLGGNDQPDATQLPTATMNPALLAGIGGGSSLANLGTALSRFGAGMSKPPAPHVCR